MGGYANNGQQTTDVDAVAMGDQTVPAGSIP